MSLFAVQNVSLAMRWRRPESRARRLFFGILSFNVCIVICLLASVKFVKKLTVRTNNETLTSESVNFSTTSLPQPHSPLLCIFTTFKPTTAKIPVLSTLRRLLTVSCLSYFIHQNGRGHIKKTKKLQ